MRVAANIFWLGGKGSWSTRLREKRGKLPQPRGLVFRRSNPARPEPYQLRRANLLSESQGGLRKELIEVDFPARRTDLIAVGG